MKANLEQKLDVFLEVAKALNNAGITPAIYGSLGLYRIIGQIDSIDDIDIIIPDIYLAEKFLKLTEALGRIDCEQDMTFPHEFIRRNERIGFEPESELIKDVGVGLENLKVSELNGVTFREISKEHYLIIYRKTLARWEEKVKKIKLKIHALEKDSGNEW